MTKAERRKKILFLKSYKWIMTDIEAERQRLECMEDRMRSARTSKLSGLPRGGRPATIEDAVLDKVDLENDQIPHAEIKAQKLKAKIEASIAQMKDPRDRTILKLKFLHGCTHEQIAEQIHYSRTSERRFYNIALAHYKIPDNFGHFVTEKDWF